MVGEERGGEVSEYKWSSEESGGEMLRVVGYA